VRESLRQSTHLANVRAKFAREKGMARAAGGLGRARYNPAHTPNILNMRAHMCVREWRTGRERERARARVQVHVREREGERETEKRARERDGGRTRGTE